ncbi:MAG TPA: substrate-binding domain-containing protein [Phycisphaerae bacterium]|nr:substrate-binding domain-containing protein [Phycisphaerae bacterium]HRY68728.1 substrate-binding domain-containing protein [Phycisphaerae bacterium]HSA29545.1 substrate-binding domain-containing protein [Phycisphaerae bacterium]
MVSETREVGALAARLVRQVRRQVLSGRLAGGTELPSVRKLASLSGIGKDTASQVLRCIEKEGWAKRESGYSLRITDDAVAVARKHSELEPPTVIVMLAGKSIRGFDPGMVDLLIEGISQVFHSASFRSIYFDLSRWMGVVRQCLEEGKQLSCEVGYVLRSLPSEVYQFFASSRVPCVVLGHCDPSLSLPSAVMDMVEVGRLVGNALCPAGRLVALCQDNLVGSEIQIIEGVREVAASLGCRVPAPADFHYHLPTDFSGAVAGIDRLLAGRDRPAGLLALRPDFALAALKVAARRGIRIPDELQLIGLNHHPVFRYVHPAITSVGDSWVEVGRQCAMFLGDALAHLPTTASRYVAATTMERQESTQA